MAYYSYLIPRMVSKNPMIPYLIATFIVANLITVFSILFLKILGFIIRG